MTRSTDGVQLTAATMPTVGRGVAVPDYPRDRAAASTAHLGVGGFHRAHQAMYHDRLLHGGDPQAGIVGVGVLKADLSMRDALRRQDCLYTLVAKHRDGTHDARVIGSLVDYVYAPDDAQALLALLSEPRIRVVSLTVTEGGYLVDGSGDFAAGDAGVRRDVAAGESPTSAFGLLIEALRRRRAAGTAPFTVMSCDNLPGNGTLTRQTVTSFAALRDDALASWIERETRFPNSMVDRITPGTTHDDRADLLDRFGVRDRWPVVCEPFTQWVLEDAFVGDRPAYEDVGVQVVDDVEPYELMKLRMLNAGHQALGYLGVLAGLTSVYEAADDELLHAFLAGYLRGEARPTLPEVPGIDLDDYAATLLDRFANPHVGDTLARLCENGSDRIPKFVLPVIRVQLESGGELRRAATVVAAWARYCEGTDDRGGQIDIVDRLAERLQRLAVRDDPRAFLDQRDVFGDLSRQHRFVDAYVRARESLREHGARTTLARLTQSI
ncbi:mannitol dehydrogenase family protein [uncultured Jatrophihabitans sp.]|uniref:mannitol dehydrogenase family protein n=1 Tax=uncultured Jatrophihabitans sp. TaxID=1610747 RepID=UPI0035CB10CA